MTIKVMVRSLKIELLNGDYKYYVSFGPLDKAVVCNEIVFLGINNDKDIFRVEENKLIDMATGESFFGFISVHAKEYFISTINEKYEITEVRLIYG